MHKMGEAYFHQSVFLADNIERPEYLRDLLLHSRVLVYNWWGKGEIRKTGDGSLFDPTFNSAFFVDRQEIDEITSGMAKSEVARVRL